MKEVKRTNIVIVNLQQYVEIILRYNLYTMDVDHEKIFYNYRSFNHIVKHYKNKRIVGQRRQISY